MFNVFQVVSVDFSRNFSKPQGLPYREEARNFSRSLRLYKMPQPIYYVKSSEFLQDPGHLSRTSGDRLRSCGVFKVRCCKRTLIRSPKRSLFFKVFTSTVEDEIFRFYHIIISLCRWHIDDILYVWTGSEEQIGEFLQNMNSKYPYRTVED